MTFARAIAATEEDMEMMLMELWKDYYICDCITKLDFA